MSAPLPNLPALIDRSSARLVAARSSAEVLEAKAMAEAALHYARVTKAANDTHADCLRIITRAEMRMANEIDAGQERGEIARGRPKESVQTSDSLGLDRRRVAEWREVRDAGDDVVEEAIKNALDEGRAPTKGEILDAARDRAGKRKRYVGRPFEEESQHDRDLRMLKGVWDGACESAQRAFLEWLSAPSDLPPHDPETGEIIDQASPDAGGPADAGPVKASRPARGLKPSEVASPVEIQTAPGGESGEGPPAIRNALAAPLVATAGVGGRETAATRDDPYNADIRTTFLSRV